MRQLLRVIPGGLCFLAAAAALFCFYGELRYQSSKEAGRLAVSGLGLQAEKEQALAVSSAASKSWGAGSEAFAELGNLLRSRADDAAKLQDRLDTYCAALAAFGGALQHEPLNSHYLVNWANLRQMLGRYDCRRKYTSGDYAAALKLALKLDPTNTAVLFASGLLYLMSGEKLTALELFNKCLRFGMNLGAAQERFLFDQVKTPAELEALVPARFPQVVYWAELLNRYTPQRVDLFQEALGRMELRAIAESSAEFESKKIPAELHFSRLLSVLDLAATRAVRQQIDIQMAVYLRRAGLLDLAEYFAERSNLKELEILRSAIENDTRPLRSSLNLWDLERDLYLDRFFTTVGFYLPSRSNLKLIELRPARETGELVSSALKVYGSSDNRSWVEITSGLKINNYRAPGISLVVLKPETEQFKYWKINFANPMRHDAFGNSLSRLVRVYGISGY